MKYIYSSSTYPIFLGLYLKLKGEEIHFLYTRKNYSDLFTSLNVQSTFIDVPSFWDFILKPNKLKKELRNINNLIGKDDLIFTHLQFAKWLFVILSNRQNGAKSYFYNFEPKTRNRISIIYVIQNLKDFILACLLKVILKLNYNTDTILSFYSRTFFLSLDEMSFNKKNIIEKNFALTFEELLFETLPQIQINYKKVNNIYIAGSEINYKEKVYKAKSIEKVKEFIEKNNITVKPHPSGWIHPDSADIISPHIPSEFLFNSITNSILSINSTTLIAASNFYRNDSKVKIICLMKLVKWLDSEPEKEMMNRIITRSKNNILFPESFEELEKIIFQN